MYACFSLHLFSILKVLPISIMLMNVDRNFQIHLLNKVRNAKVDQSARTKEPELWMISESISNGM